LARKRVTAVVKINLPAGAATPAPPVGTALGPHGIQTMEFVKQYNAATEAQRGQIIPVEVTIFEDRSFTFVLKTPPTAELLKQAAKIDKGSSTNKRTIVGSVSRQQVEEIANTKMKDLNAYSLEAAVKQVIGTATSMGIKVVEE
jgi:large subunit ribosomal protein L11